MEQATPPPWASDVPTLPADLAAYLPPDPRAAYALIAWLQERGVSSRPRAVILLDLAGLTRAEIAHAMCVSVLTVKDYWRDIYARLQVASRQELRQHLRALIQQHMGETSGRAEMPPAPVHQETTRPEAEAIQTPIARPVQVGLLARTHLEQVGLAALLDQASTALPLSVAVVSARADAVRAYSLAHRLDLLLAAPHLHTGAREVAEAQQIPLLVYAGLDEAREALADEGLSVLVGPAPAEELSRALGAVLQGERYRQPQIGEVLALTPRQRQLVAHLAAGASLEQAAGALNMSPVRVQLVLAELYRQLRLMPSRAALRAWAREAPMYLLTPGP